MPADPQQDRNVETRTSECPNCGQPDGQHHNLCQQEAVWELQESVNQLEEKINEMNSRPSQTPQNAEAGDAVKGVVEDAALKAEMARLIEEVEPSIKLEAGLDGLMKEHRAMRSSAKFIHEKIEPCKCDHEGISACHRCQSVYLSSVIGRLLKIYDEAFSWKPRPKLDELSDRLRLALSATGDDARGGDGELAAYIERILERHVKGMVTSGKSLEMTAAEVEALHCLSSNKAAIIAASANAERLKVAEKIINDGARGIQIMQRGGDFNLDGFAKRLWDFISLSPAPAQTPGDERPSNKTPMGKPLTLYTTPDPQRVGLWLGSKRGIATQW